MGELFWRLIAGVALLAVCLGLIFQSFILCVDVLIVGSLSMALLYMLVDYHCQKLLQPEREKYSSYQLRLLGNIPKRLDDTPPIRVEISPLFRHGSK